MEGPGPPTNLTPDDVRSVKEFGAALTTLRLICGLSVRDVARLAQGIPASTLGGYFSGRHLPPPTRPEVLGGVLTALGVPAVDQEPWHRAAQRLHSGRLPRTAAPNPYRGLAAYEVDDSEVFFGREALAQHLTATVQAVAASPESDRIVVLLGASGSGKSSVIRAGVIPSLPQWAYAVVSPGPEPLVSLSTGIATIDAVENALLVVDQLEELWTLGSPSDREQFLEALNQWSSDREGRVVVCCLRADFFASATESAILLEALRTHQVVVGPMSREDLRRIITAPAAATGVDLAPELVDLILEDADPAGAPGDVHVLPHLSHALLLMWLTGDRRRLTGDDYARVGGIRGGVTRTADTAYTTLPEDLRPMARRVLLRMVVVEADAPPTGAVVPMQTLLALGDPDHVRSIVDHFATQRILTVSEEGCRFSHEAVIDRWNLLREWIASDRARLAVSHMVDREAEAWVRAERDHDQLLRGSRLRAALEWAGDDPPPADSAAAQYLSASEADEQRVTDESDRAHRRVRRWLAATVVLALVTTVATVVSVRARQDANRRNIDSISRQIAVASGGLTAVNSSLGHQLGVAAYAKAASSDAIGALLDATAGTQVARHLSGAGQRALAASPAAGLVAVTGPEGKVNLHKVSDLAHPLSTTPAPTNGNADSLVFAAAFSPDGRTLAVGGMSASVRLIDTSDPARPRAITDVSVPGTGTIYALAWSDDGSLIQAGTEKLGVQRWLMGPAPTLLQPIKTTGVAQAVAAIPGTDDVVVGDSTNGDVTIWRGVQRATLVSRTNAGAPVVSLAVSPEGDRLAAGTQTGTVVSMPLEGGKPGTATTLAAGVTWINALAWAPDGTRLYAASSDLTVRSWDREGALGRQLTLAGLVTALVFGDETTLVAGLSTGEVDSWTTRGPELFPDATSVFAGDWVDGGDRLVAFAGRPVRAAVVFDTQDPMHPHEVGRTPAVPERCGVPNSTGSTSRDASLVVLGTSSGCFIGYDLRTPASPITRFVVQPSQEAPQQIRVLGDGSGFLSGGDDRVARWWPVQGSADPIPRILEGPTNGITGVELSADGSLAAAASLDHTVYVWRLKSAAGSTPAGSGPIAPAARITRPDAAITVAIDATGQRLAVAGSDPSVAVYDIGTLGSPREVDTLTGLTAGAYGVAFDPQGGLGAALSNGRIALWHKAGDGYRPWTVLRAGTVTPALLAQLAWHPEGKHLVGVGTAGASRVWLIDPAAAKEFVCSNAGTPMTASEWDAAITDVEFGSPCS